MKSNMKKNRERGSALVEGALVFLVVFSMLIAIVDFGQFLFIHQTLTERAREGVRYGIVNNPTDTTSIQNIVLYGQASGGSVPTSPSSSDTGIFSVQRSNVIVSTTGSGSDDRLLVQIQNYKYSIYSPTISGSYTGPNITAALPLGINY
jgi:Flp pilus assembly protein TadG